jgi:hypothetical protein
MSSEPEKTAGAIATLKRAGVPTIVSILVVLASSPGFYEAFWDDNEEEATAKAIEAGAAAEVAYEVLRVRFEAQSEEVADLKADIRDLRNLIRDIMWERLRAPDRSSEPEPTINDIAEAPEVLFEEPEPVVEQRRLPMNLRSLIDEKLKGQ